MRVGYWMKKFKYETSEKVHALFVRVEKKTEKKDIEISFRGEYPVRIQKTREDGWDCACDLIILGIHSYEETGKAAAKELVSVTRAILVLETRESRDDSEGLLKRRKFNKTDKRQWDKAKELTINAIDVTETAA